MPLLKTPPGFLQFLYLVIYPESDYFTIAKESKGISAITRRLKLRSRPEEQGEENSAF